MTPKKGLELVLDGGVATGEQIVLNPRAPGDNNLAHTSAFVALNQGACAAAFMASGTDQVNNHTKLFALLGPGVMVQPPTLMSPTFDMRDMKQAGQMWTWGQMACGRAVADLIEEGVIPKNMAEKLIITLQVFIHKDADNNEAIFMTQYRAAKEAITRAIEGTQDVAFMLQHRTTTVHLLCQDDKGMTYTPEAVQNLIDEVQA